MANNFNTLLKKLEQGTGQGYTDMKEEQGHNKCTRDNSKKSESVEEKN